MAQRVLYNNNGRADSVTLQPSSVDLGNVTNDLQIPKSIVTAKGDIITSTGNTTPVRQGVGSNGQIIVGDDNLANGIGYKDPSFRNWVINSNMEVAQRGTSFSFPSGTADGSTYALDRFQFDWNNMGSGTFPNITVSQEKLTPGDIYNSYNYMRIAFDGAGSSLGSNAFFRFSNYIEYGTRYLCGLGKKVTLSFYARSNVSNKKLLIFGVQNYGTGGSPSSDENLTAYSPALSSAWEKYSYVITTNTLIGQTFGTNNNDYLRLVIYLSIGTGAYNFLSSGYVDIAQVALYAGDVAYPFEPVPFDIELQRCMRYYEKSYAYETYAGASAWVSSLGFSGAGGNCSIGNYMTYWGHYKVPKRISATPIIYDQSGNIGKVNLTKYDGNADLNSTASVVHPTREGFCVVTQSTSVAQRGMYFHYICDADY